MTTAAPKGTKGTRRADAAEAERLAAFKRRVAREQAKRVYTDRASWDAGEEDLGAMALYEMVHEFQAVTRSLRQALDYLQGRVRETVERLDQRWPLYGDTILSHSEVDALLVKRRTLVDAITRLAWATGWHVSEVEAPEAFAQWQRIATLSVTQGTDGQWRIRSGANDLSAVDLGLGCVEQGPMGYETEAQAWRAAAAWCGERW
jgi:hypothetical protein